MLVNKLLFVTAVSTAVKATVWFPFLSHQRRVLIAYLQVTRCDLFQVGWYLKNPKYPIWLLGSETHLTVLFSLVCYL